VGHENYQFVFSEVFLSVDMMEKILFPGSMIVLEFIMYDQRITCQTPIVFSPSAVRHAMGVVRIWR
jgi:hypothetical protein